MWRPMISSVISEGKYPGNIFDSLIFFKFLISDVDEGGLFLFLNLLLFDRN